jgi:nitrous oxidase accessory protein NosD
MGRTFTRTTRSSGDTGGRVTFKRGKGKGNGGGTTPTPTDPPADTTPAAFTFTPVTGAAVSTLTASNNMTPTGFDAAVTLTVPAGMEYSLDNGSTWASVERLFTPGSTLKVRLTSSANPLTPVALSANLGGVLAEFSVTTAAGAAPEGTLVSTAAELQAELLTAVDGDIIRVAAGSYPFTLVTGKVFGTDVTIKADNPASKPVFEGLHFRSCTHIKVQDIETTMSVAPRYGVYMLTCTDMTVTGCLARGSAAVAFAADAHAMFARDSERITITDNEIKWTEFGIGHLDCDTLTITDNDIHDIQCDGVRGGGSNNVTVDANRIYNFFPLTGDHADGIQFWTTNVARVTTNITVTNNLIYRGAGSSSILPQGVFFRDQIGARYHGITITGNAIVGGLYNGICVQGYTLNGVPTYSTGVVIEDNFILGFSDQRSWLRITLTDGASFSNNEYSYLANAANVNLTTGSGNVKLTEATTPGDYTLLDAWLVDHPDVPERA